MTPMTRKLVRIWDKDFNLLYSRQCQDIGEALGELHVTVDDDADNASDWRSRSSGRITSVTVANYAAEHG